MPRSSVSTEAMPTEAIQDFQKAAGVRTESIKKSLVKVPSSALYRESPTSATDVLQASDVNDDLAPELGDRIVNLCATGIPFGACGTVVGIRDPASCCVEVLMDEASQRRKLTGACCHHSSGKFDLHHSVGATIRTNWCILPWLAFVRHS
jgi:hypothetical protein